MTRPAPNLPNDQQLVSPLGDLDLHQVYVSYVARLGRGLRLDAGKLELQAMAAGVPMVLGPDLPTMEGILRSEELGRVARSMDPDDIASAIAEILALPHDERRAWRTRIAATGRERYTWPAAAAAYRRVLDDLAG